MQRLTVEMLCNQLDNTWKYFTATFKMQAESQLGFHFNPEVRTGGRPALKIESITVTI